MYDKKFFEVDNKINKSIYIKSPTIKYQKYKKKYNRFKCFIIRFFPPPPKRRRKRPSAVAEMTAIEEISIF
uniref:Uncharacterized protein n=1 Tax=Strongyloides venezuelensis TaxID=75913 RepID=A0A0K0FLX2_STRVS